MPALREGLAASNRSRDEIQISSQTILMLGNNDEQIAKARDGARAQLSFYSSTPAYRVMLDHHGWGDIQPELNKLSKQGKWLEMMSYITDEMLDVIGVAGTPTEAGAKLRERNRFADRTSLIIYNETGDANAVTHLIQAARG